MIANAEFCSGLRREQSWYIGALSGRLRNRIHPLRLKVSKPMTKDANLLVGAREIAAYFFGDAGRARSVYRLMSRLTEPHRFPMFYLGSTLCARRTEIDRWIDARTKAANDRGGRADAA